MSRWSRVMTVWLLATVAAACGITWLASTARAGATAAGFADVLVTGCAAAGAISVGWLWVLVSLVVADGLRGRPARAGVPTVVRRLVLAACGLTLAGGLAAPVHAAPVHAAPADHATPGPATARSTTALLVGLPLPDRTTTTTRWMSSVADHTPAPAPEEPREEHPGPGSVLVRPGDTLWDLAQDSLPTGASVAEVDRRWREIYRTNRDAVGVDPDLIRPGQRLLLPPERDHR